MAERSVKKIIGNIVHKMVQSCLIILILLTMEACAFRVRPLYQPLSQSSNWDGYRQGYFEYQIDDRTYLIGYSNYVTAYAILEGDWYVRSLKWLKGAQEYALYRAAEFTKGKGQQSFVVLHGDDWHYTGYGKLSSRGPVGLRSSPGAWVIIRVLDGNGVSLPKNDNRVYSADSLLESLPVENSGLAKYQRTVGPPEHKDQHVPRKFKRWRSSSSAYDSEPLPASNPQESWPLKYDLVQPGTKVTQMAPSRFTIAIWDEAQISPMQILWQCIGLANREGYKVFKLQKWTIEDHYGGNRGPYSVRIWFRDTVDVVLQHEKEPNSLESVFEVDEVLSRMVTNGAPLPR